MAPGSVFDMGKYAVFVWPAYGITAAVLLAAVVQTLLRARRWRRAAEREAGHTRDRPA